MTINWAAQAVAAVGFISFIISFQIKSNKALLVLQMFSDLMFCVQFILLGAISGCLSLFSMVLRNVVILFKEKHKWARWYGWVIVFTLLLLACTIYSWAGIKSLLPFVASAVSTFAYWRDNARAYRTSNLFCSCPCWLIYNVIVGSYVGILNETITMLSIIISIIRFGWKALDGNSFERESKKRVSQS